MTGAAVRTLRVVVVYPDLLGTYGDGGNGLVLARRAEWRGIAVELTESPSDLPLPDADLYCLGGGEDGPQARAAEALASDGTLAAAVGRGAVVLAVCAGFQIVGRSFPSAVGAPVAGLGLLDVTTARGVTRAVGEVLADPEPIGTQGGGTRLPVLTGFENHAGRTTLGPTVHPLGAVGVGVGNGGGTEGAVSGRVVGTYLHGPVLARNPALADLLLGWALDDARPLEPLDDAREDALRAERLATVRRRGRRRLWRTGRSTG
jgi:CobQ-like glutamine amidotransferase family enzyme